MDEKQRRETALFRFAVIGGIVSNTSPGKKKEELYRELSQNTYEYPKGHEVKVSAATIKSWYLAYCKGGFNALYPKQRCDIGHSRCLTEENKARILEIKAKFPKITAVKIREKMIEEGSIREIDASEDTFQRFIKSIPELQVEPKEEVLAFEFEHVNDCWQGDTQDGPTITVGKTRRKTYCISFIDDHSRKFTGSELYFEDNSVNVLMTLKKAVRIYGVPKILVLDNGTPYKNAQFKDICHEIGIGKIHLRPYQPKGKGKVERNQKTTQQRIFDCNSFDEYQDLTSLNTFYQGELRKEHDQKINRMTGESPDRRFMKEYDFIKRVPTDHLDIIFMFRESRTLNKDSTIWFRNRRYEVPQEYINTLSGKRPKIPFRYDPIDPCTLYIINEGTYVIRYTLKPVDLVANSKRKRKTTSSPIDYTMT